MRDPSYFLRSRTHHSHFQRHPAATTIWRPGTGGEGGNEPSCIVFPSEAGHGVADCSAQKDLIAVAMELIQAQAETRYRFGHEFPIAMPPALGILNVV